MSSLVIRGGTGPLRAIQRGVAGEDKVAMRPPYWNIRFPMKGGGGTEEWRNECESELPEKPHTGLRFRLYWNLITAFTLVSAWEDTGVTY